MSKTDFNAKKRRHFDATVCLDSDEKGKILLKMVEIKARGAAKAEFTNVNEHFAATNNAEFGLFQQNLPTAASADVPRTP
jgi:hypothetical protein